MNRRGKNNFHNNFIRDCGIILADSRGIEVFAEAPIFIKHIHNRVEVLKEG